MWSFVLLLSLPLWRLIGREEATLERMSKSDEAQEERGEQVKLALPCAMKSA